MDVLTVGRGRAGRGASNRSRTPLSRRQCSTPDGRTNRFAARHSRTVARFSCLLLVVGLSGCADGPFGNLAALNPVIRKQWAADEQLGTTFYQRMQELDAMGGAVRRMDAAQRQQAVQQLTALVRSDPNPLLRSRAVRVLSQIEDDATLTALNLAAGDEDPQVRVAVCQALGEARNRPALQSLARILSTDEHLDVRMAAARELGNYRDPEAYRALATALRDSDPAMQHRAMLSLRNASGRDFGGDLAAWQQFAETGDAQAPPSESWARRLIGWR
jgi:hypothetical protein